MGREEEQEIGGQIPVLEKISWSKKGAVARSQAIGGEIMQVCFQIFTILSFNFDLSSFLGCL